MRAAKHVWTFASLALLVSGLTAAPVCAQAPAGEKYALLIGVKHYAKGELRSLQYTEADVEGLAAVLADSGYRRQNMLLLTQKAGAANPALNPTLANIRTAVKRWVDNRSEGDSLLIAFAGHGVQFRGSRIPYFCPADAKLKEPQKTLLPVGEVYALLQGSKAGFKLLLVDACRNDPLVDMSRGAGGSALQLPEVPLDSDFRPDSATEGGALALYSCSRGEKAYEHDSLKHSVFYHFVIQGLAGEADKQGNRDGKVSLPELLEYVQYNVPKFSRREFQVRQMPELQGVLRGTVAVAMVKDYRPDRPSDVIRPRPEPKQLFSLTGHTGRVWSVALSPNGRLAASASGDQTVRLWDAHTGQGLRTLIGHSGEVEAVAFSADGGLVATGGEDKVVRVWNTNGKEIQRFPGHRGVIRALAFSRDGKWLVSAGVDGGLRLWDLTTHKWRYTYEGHTNSVYGLAIGPDSWHVFSGSHDKTVRYWGLGQGKELWRGYHNGIVYGVAISPDGRWGLSGSADRTMCLWNLKTGAKVRVFRHPNEVNGVAFSPDSRHAISGCDDGVVRVWDLSNGQVQKSFKGHSKLVFAVACAADGRTALSGSFDNTVRLWSLAGVIDAAPGPIVRANEPPPVLVERADLQIRVSWNTATDVDLRVVEPDGTECYFGRKKTPGGGCLLRDVQDGTQGPEEYQAVRAQRGTYRVKLHYYSGPLRGQTQPTQVTVVVRRFVGTPQAQTYRYTYTLTRKDQVVEVCTIGF